MNTKTLDGSEHCTQMESTIVSLCSFRRFIYILIVYMHTKHIRAEMFVDDFVLVNNKADVYKTLEQLVPLQVNVQAVASREVREACGAGGERGGNMVAAAII